MHAIKNVQNPRVLMYTDWQMLLFYVLFVMLVMQRMGLPI